MNTFKFKSIQVQFKTVRSATSKVTESDVKIENEVVRYFDEENCRENKRKRIDEEESGSSCDLPKINTWLMKQVTENS